MKWVDLLMILIDLMVVLIDLGPRGLYEEIYNVRARDSYTCPTPYGEYRLSDNIRIYGLFTLRHSCVMTVTVLPIT